VLAKLSKKMANNWYRDSLPLAQPKDTTRMSIVTQCGIVGILYILFYSPLVPGLIMDWTRDIYSYGVLVPLIAGYLISRKIDHLKTVTIAPTSAGCAPLVLAVLLCLVGQLVADSFLMRLSMVLAFAALTQTLFGKDYFYALLFPLFYLFFMIPVPFALVGAITNFLMLFDALLAAKAIQTLGIPIYLDANLLQLPNITVEVADVCSGVSSVLALFVLGLAYSYCLPISSILKIALTASTIPLAIAANLIRITVTVVLTNYYGRAVLESFFHQFYGTFNFVFSVALLLTLGETLRKRFPSVLRKGEVTYQASVLPSVRGTAWRATLASSVILATSIYVSGSVKNIQSVESGIDLERLPMSLGAYAIVNVGWSDIYSDDKAQKKLSRLYSDPSGIPVELFIGSQGNSSEGRLQSPKLFFPDRWNPIWVRAINLSVGRSTHKANLMLTQRGNSRRLILYWYQFRKDIFTGELYYRFASLNRRIRGDVGEMAVIRIVTPILPLEGKPLDNARERLQQFVVFAVPEISKVLAPS
jgi:EpsI family protein